MPSGHDVVRNPGSRGHPDLCLRPCLYYSQGNCINGNECSFCHLPHPKRPVRFDKLHRESLKRMSFGQFVSIMLPVLKQKARDLDISPEVGGLLSELWAPLEEQVLAGATEEALADRVLDSPVCNGHGGQGGGLSTWLGSVPSSAISSTASVSGSERSTRRGSFGGALQVMGFRPLLSMLLTKTPENLTDIRSIVEKVLKGIHDSNTTTSDTWRMGSSLSETGASCAAAGGALREFEHRAFQPSSKRQLRPQAGGHTSSRERQKHRAESLFQSGCRSYTDGGQRRGVY